MEKTVTETAELKNYVDHIAFTPFGVHVNPEELKRKDLANSFADTNFPMIYLNLCTEGKNRLIKIWDSVFI